MITVPKSALIDADDAGETLSPEVGDSIDLGGVKAKVRAIKGDNYDLDVESVNGAAIECGKDESAAHEATESSLQEMAEDDDKKRFGA